MEAEYGSELREIEHIIAAIDSEPHKTKVSREKTMRGKVLYKPASLNDAFEREFAAYSWQKYKIHCEYPTEYYTSDYTPAALSKGAFREIDFVKNCIGQ